MGHAGVEIFEHPTGPAIGNVQLRLYPCADLAGSGGGFGERARQDERRLGRKVGRDTLGRLATRGGHREKQRAGGQLAPELAGDTGDAFARSRPCP